MTEMDEVLQQFHTMMRSPKQSGLGLSHCPSKERHYQNVTYLEAEQEQTNKSFNLPVVLTLKKFYYMKLKILPGECA